MPPKRGKSNAARAAERAAAPGDGTDRRDRIAALALVALVGFVFRGGLSNGLVGDDFSLINYCRLDGLVSILRDFDPVHEVWYYRPLTKLVFGFSHALWGTAATPYHVLSLFAHAVTVVLLYFVARRAGARAVPSFAGALLFAVHFRQHESVFWFSAISYPLSTGFGLASALAFRASLATRRPGLLASALVFSAAAMLTKDTATVVPVLAGAYGLLFGLPRTDASVRVAIRRVAPLVAVLLLGVGLQAVPVAGRPFARGGAGFSPKGPAETLALIERAATLTFPGLEGLGEPARLVLALGALAGLGAYVFARRTPLALLGLGWAVLAFLPFFVFMPQIGDLYLYLPLAGLALVVVDLAGRLAAAPRTLRGAAAVGCAAFVLWSAGRIGEKALKWRAAGAIVNGVVAEVKAARPNLPRGGTLVLEGLPEYVGGVYAFQNAVPAAFWLVYGDRTLNVLRPVPGEAPQDAGDPHFLYEDGRLYELDSLGRRRLLRVFSEPD